MKWYSTNPDFNAGPYQGTKDEVINDCRARLMVAKEVLNIDVDALEEEFEASLEMREYKEIPDVR